MTTHLKELSEQDNESWMQNVELSFVLQTRNGLPATGTLHVLMRVEGDVDLAWSPRDGHVKLATMAKNLVSSLELNMDEKVRVNTQKSRQLDCESHRNTVKIAA